MVASHEHSHWGMLLGKYCSGFSGGRHRITVLPGQKGGQSIQAMLYDHADTFLEIRNVGFKGMDPQALVEWYLRHSLKPI